MALLDSESFKPIDRFFARQAEAYHLGTAEPIRTRLRGALQDRPPQREMANAVQQAANVRGAFAVISAPPPGTGILLDDRRSSGWTLAMVGGQLRRAGAERIVPLALGTLT